jgi:hypothetical protein
MSRVHVLRPILDEAGNLIPGASVQVDAEATDAPTTQTLWASREISDATEFVNPIVTSTGILDFWMTEPERLKLTVTVQGRPDEVVIVDALPSGSEIVQSIQPLRITNTPAVGEVLFGGASAGEAEWGAAPASVLTAEVPGTAYATGAAILGAVTQETRDTDAGSVNGDLGYLFPVAPGAAIAPAVYTIDDAPNDPLFTYTDAVRIDGEVGEVTEGNFVRLPATMADGGRVELWVRVSSSPGSAKTVVAVQPVNEDDYTNHWVRRVAFDASQHHMWVHLFIEVPYTNDGLVEILVGETNSQSNDDVSTALAFIQPTSGGVFPPHNHGGAGVDSLAVGTGASAAGDFSIAVGVNADAPQSYSYAVGYDAQAQGLDGAQAVGASTRANASGATAIGYAAEASGVNSMAVGNSAQASANNASAIGHTARAIAADATAVGADTLADGTNSVAIGSGASARASDSVAIGEGATVDAAHSGSVAIGRGAASTGANQIALGSAQHVVLVQGTWRNLGDTQIGDTDSRVGFFGSAGEIKQEVTGSRGGNVALAALLTALDNLGLITDSSTA